MHSAEELLVHEPDALVPDLLDAELVMETLANL
jgi:hypothetical protein